MLVQNSYYFFKQALKPEVCEKIIRLGEDRIEQAKAKGVNVEATTMGNNHKQAMERQGLSVVSQGEKSITN